MLLESKMKKYRDKYVLKLVMRLYLPYNIIINMHLCYN